MHSNFADNAQHKQNNVDIMKFKALLFRYRQ